MKKNDTVNVKFIQITKGQPLVDLSDFVKRFWRVNTPKNNQLDFHAKVLSSSDIWIRIRWDIRFFKCSDEKIERKR